MRLRDRPDRCQHGVAADHQATAVGQREDGTIVPVWRCSLCGRESVWEPGWRSLGTVECPQCWRPVVERVECGTCAKQEAGG